MNKSVINKHELLYYAAEKQKDYEPLLTDPTTPEDVITDVVDRITMEYLKILAFKHPNISERSVRYILTKAEKKKNQKLLIAILWENHKITQSNLQMIRNSYNIAGRFDKFTIELLKENASFYKHNIILIMGDISRSVDMKHTHELFEAAINHKDTTSKMVSAVLHNDRFMLDDETLVSIIVESDKIDDEFIIKWYEKTGNEKFLPKEAKDLFLF